MAILFLVRISGGTTPIGYPMDILYQADIDTMFSHINATLRWSLGDRNPFEVFAFCYDKTTPAQLNIARIARDDVILKLALLFRKGRK